MQLMQCVCRRSSDSLRCLVNIFRVVNEQMAARVATKLFIIITNATVNSMKNSCGGIHPLVLDNRNVGLSVLNPALLLYVSSSFLTTSLGCLSYSSGGRKS